MSSQLRMPMSLGVIISLVIGGTFARAAPTTTAFTYQGQLKDGGVPADGIYDLRFTLIDALSAGAAVGSPVTINDWDVVNGLFSVELDFGANPFDGNARWLLIEVRPGASAGAYTALSPRQPLTAVPYALYAMDGPGQAGFWAANGSSIYKTNSGSVGIGATDPQANLEVRSSGSPRLRVAKIHTGGFGVFAPAILELKSNFTGTDQPYGKVNFLDGNDVVQGSIEYGNAPGLLAPVSLRLGTAGLTRLTITDAGDVGIGTPAPANALSIVGSADVSGSLGIGNSAPAVKLHVAGGSDTSPGGGGFIVTGDVAGLNLSIDNNEIMARNNGSPATLYLNHGGGSVVTGGGAVIGGNATVNGKLDIGYQVVITTPSGPWGTFNIPCPAGKKVMGGGCNPCVSGEGDVESYPFDDGSGWVCRLPADTCTFGHGWAICANLK